MSRRKRFDVVAFVYTNLVLFMGLFVVMFGFVSVILITHGGLGWSLQTWQSALVPGVALIGVISFVLMTWLYNRVMGQSFGRGRPRKGTGIGLPSRPGFLKRGGGVKSAGTGFGKFGMSKKGIGAAYAREEKARLRTAKKAGAGA